MTTMRDIHITYRSTLVYNKLRNFQDYKRIGNIYFKNVKCVYMPTKVYKCRYKKICFIWYVISSTKVTWAIAKIYESRIQSEVVRKIEQLVTNPTSLLSLQILFDAPHLFCCSPILVHFSSSLVYGSTQENVQGRIYFKFSVVFRHQVPYTISVLVRILQRGTEPWDLS